MQSANCANDKAEKAGSEPKFESRSRGAGARGGVSYLAWVLGIGIGQLLGEAQAQSQATGFAFYDVYPEYDRTREIKNSEVPFYLCPLLGPRPLGHTQSHERQQVHAASWDVTAEIQRRAMARKRKRGSPTTRVVLVCGRTGSRGHLAGGRGDSGEAERRAGRSRDGRPAMIRLRYSTVATHVFSASSSAQIASISAASESLLILFHGVF